MWYAKIWYWAHKNKRDCDNWREKETEWHRTWKNNYPANWQEISLVDKRTNEKHIADVFTIHGLVIEFQHSSINPQERTSREQFSKNMVWVVDGTRLKRDYPRFLKEWKRGGISEVRQTEKLRIFEVWYPEFCFPENWLESSVPVIFDFKGDGLTGDSEGLRNTLYCLFPQVGRYARVAEISRKAFINATTNGEWTCQVQEFIKNYRKQDEIEQRKKIVHPSSKVIYSWRGIPLIGGYKEYRKRSRKL